MHVGFAARGANASGVFSSNKEDAIDRRQGGKQSAPVRPRRPAAGPAPCLGAREAIAIDADDEHVAFARAASRSATFPRDGSSQKDAVGYD